jgi:nitroreductase
VSEKSPEEIEKIKHAPVIEGVPELILQRWSPRAFAERKIAPEDLKKLFVGASWAASSYNEQPWRFLVGRRGDETYKKIFASLVQPNQLWAKSAPVLVLSVGKKSFGHNGSPNKYGLHDTGAATAYMGLQATALGLHTHSMGGFDNDLARASFGIPSDYEIGAVTAVGYFGDPSWLPGQMYENEVLPRTRKPVEEFVFSEWEKPATF